LTKNSKTYHYFWYLELVVFVQRIKHACNMLGYTMCINMSLCGIHVVFFLDTQLTKISK